MRATPFAPPQQSTARHAVLDDETLDARGNLRRPCFDRKINSEKIAQLLFEARNGYALHSSADRRRIGKKLATQLDCAHATFPLATSFQQSTNGPGYSRDCPSLGGAVGGQHLQPMFQRQRCIALRHGVRHREYPLLAISTGKRFHVIRRDFIFLTDEIA